VSKDEYARALLINLLRYIRFPTVPLPKKALAVRMAGSLLELAGSGA
jgi:hypothetical protein